MVPVAGILGVQAPTWLLILGGPLALASEQARRRRRTRNHSARRRRVRDAVKPRSLDGVDISGVCLIPRSSVGGSWLVLGGRRYPDRPEPGSDFAH